ncbi:Diacylglycerol kinase family enzyme [Hymenobacter daecheongensis DSM 21074]|uniref:Diacylglycerol kinase family enzyme n=1 Tax=Hymenobacter daecheongensis DSM 21074 TaxID=1121955 RepID=A0A1M6JWJ3_9BACT|nr:Diacylglycerol kinase family enzyme [Hymenobacter daecheongensis DSM 21074]
MRQLLFVLNPISGDIDKSELEATITAFCVEHGRQAAFFHTTGEQDQQRLQTELLRHTYDAVFACGGDGTVSLVAGVLAGTSLPLGILPLGSGNGLSKDLGIPQDLPGALRLMWEHTISPLDTLRINNNFSAHLADLGFNALVVERFSAGDTRGPGAYVRIATHEYLAYEPALYRIRTDRGETFEGPAFMVTMANGNTFGSNVVINPDSRLDDGEFEICLIAPFPGTAALGVLYQLYTRDFDASLYTQRLRCRWAEIEVIGQARVLGQLDGEPLELTAPIRAEIIPRSLRVLLPPAPPTA